MPYISVGRSVWADRLGGSARIQVRPVVGHCAYQVLPVLNRAGRTAAKAGCDGLEKGFLRPEVVIGSTGTGRQPSRRFDQSDARRVERKGPNLDIVRYSSDTANP